MLYKKIFLILCVLLLLGCVPKEKYDKLKEMETLISQKQQAIQPALDKINELEQSSYYLEKQSQIDFIKNEVQGSINSYNSLVIEYQQYKKDNRLKGNINIEVIKWEQ